MKKQKSKIALSIITSLVLSSSMYAKDTIQEFDKLTVTAQKSEENIQNVPISMSVFDEYSIEDNQIKTIQDISSYTPNLMFIDLGGSDDFRPTMRGLSSLTNFSSSVSLFIDGIPVSSQFGFNETLLDIERIEVLKGPQGTLYGKDTHAGAINVITKKPNNKTKLNTKIELGSDNKREYTLNTSGAIIKDKFFISLAAKHYEKDGFIKNIYLNKIVDDREHNYGKVHFRYTPTENLDISLISSQLKRDDGGNRLNRVNVTTKEVSNEREVYNKSKVTSHALKIEYDLGKYKLQSISTYRKFKDIASCDYDFSSMAFSQAKKDNTYKKSSQELRLNMEEKNAHIVSGLYFDKEKNTVSSINDKGNSIGIFTHIDYKINDKASLVSGIRYDRDKKMYNDSIKDLSNTYNSLSPKLAFEYKLNNKSMLYTSVSKGYKSGGYHFQAPSGYEKKYDKEELWSYEIGSKNLLLDNQLLLNTSIYYMNISDMQVFSAVNVQGQSFVSNAAKATSKGFELEAKYSITDELTFFTSLGINETKMDQYKDSQGDYSGKYNVYSPKYNYDISFQYRNSEGYYGKIDLIGFGKMYLDKLNTKTRKAYEIVNTKIGYESENFDIYLYGKNIFNKEYNANGTYNGWFMAYSEPREIGIQVAYRF